MELKQVSDKAELRFEDLEFEDRQETIRVSFLKNFYFDLERQALQRIGDFELHKNAITFLNTAENTARNRFNALLDYGLASLMSKVTKKPAFYVHRYSGIPLIGSNVFGLIDRNTNIIEVKPLTGCNENCIYCSVDEGLSTSKTSEIVVEKDYLVQEFKKLVAFKGCEVEAYINSQGEPTLYGKLPGLIRDLKSIENVRGVVMNSNGSVLDEEYIDQLAGAGLKRLNLSLNAIDEKKAKVVAGWGLYNIGRIKQVAEYAAKKMELLIAPVWLPGYNDEEIPKLIRYAMGIGAKIGVQNYLYYKRGRNPATPMEWDKFYEKLAGLEKEFGINLTKMDLKNEFRIMATKNLPKPFRKGQVIDARIMCPGRYPKEKIAVAVTGDKGDSGKESAARNITIINCSKEQGTVRAKIIRTKHNVFSAVALSG